MRPTEPSQNSTEREELTFWFLDSLVDAPCSFAASYVHVSHEQIGAGLDTGALLTVAREALDECLVECRITTPQGDLRTAGEDDWARAAREYPTWLTSNSIGNARDASLDHVGLWFQITQAGRTSWASLAARVVPDTEKKTRCWDANFAHDENAIVARAPSEEEALEAVERLAQALNLRVDKASLRTFEVKDARSNDIVIEVRCKVTAHVA